MCKCVCVYVCMYVCVYVCMCVCVYVCMFIPHSGLLNSQYVVSPQIVVSSDSRRSDLYTD